MTEGGLIPDEDYRQFIEFIGRTPRGRAFLDEHSRRARIMATDEVYTLVRDLRDSWREHAQIANATKHIEVLRRELQDMSASISRARREIASLRPKNEGGSDRIISATNELDQIVLSTERASIEILNAAERIMELIGKLRSTVSMPEDICRDLENEATNIFTACSFQDLTGQRTTKVVNALRYIEQRIAAMMNIWGIDEGEHEEVIPDNHDKRPDAHLLNGPDASGIDQDEVDRLLNGLAAATGGSSAPSSAPALASAAKPAAPAELVEEEFTEPLDQSEIDSLFN